MYAQYGLGNPSFCNTMPFGPTAGPGFGNFGMTQQMLGSPFGMPQGYGMQNQLQQMMMMLQTMMMFQQMQMQGGGMGQGNFYPPMPQPFGPMCPGSGFPPFPPQPYFQGPQPGFGNQPGFGGGFGGGYGGFGGPQPGPFRPGFPPPFPNNPPPFPNNPTPPAPPRPNVGPKPATPPAPRPQPRPLTSQQWQTSLRGNPEALRSYNAMTPEQRATVDRLGMNHPAERGGADPNFLTIMGNGRLMNRDRQGQTTLQHLDTLDRQRVPAEVDKPTAYRELVSNLAEPGRISQFRRGTCAPTSVQYQHARQQPSDYARVTAGLLSERGEVRMNNGDMLVRNRSGLAPDDSQRTSVDRIYQSSMMEYGNGDRLTYDNARDKHINADGSVSHGGMYENEKTRSLDAITGTRHEAQGYDANRPGLFGIRRFALDRDMQHELREGRFPAVSMVWDTNPGARDANHALTVERIQGDYIYLRNPHGVEENGQGSGPPREVVPGQPGLVRMRKDDFYSRVYSVTEQQDDRNFASRWWDRVTNS
jgi:hypothetical protein